MVFQWILSHWKTEQWHGWHLSQKCIKSAISWTADHLPTSSSRNYKTELLLILDVHKQHMSNKVRETVLKNKIPSTLSRRVFAANFHLITGHDYIQWHQNMIGIKDSLMCPLCSDTEKVDFGHIQTCRVWRIIWTMPTIGISGGIYQDYTGLQKNKWEISL